MKDHEIREAINELCDIAIKYHEAQQLRERIAAVVLRIGDSYQKDIDNLTGLVIKGMKEQVRAKAQEMSNNTYTCERCHKTYEKYRVDWSEEHILAEMKKNWGDLPEEDRAVVCDLCYKECMEWYKKQEVK